MENKLNRKERFVVAFASDKKMDQSVESVPENPRFFMSRPLIKADGVARHEEDFRAKWWPGEEPSRELNNLGK